MAIWAKLKQGNSRVACWFVFTHGGIGLHTIGVYAFWTLPSVWTDGGAALRLAAVSTSETCICKRRNAKESVLDDSLWSPLNSLHPLLTWTSVLASLEFDGLSACLRRPSGCYWWLANSRVGFYTGPRPVDRAMPYPPQAEWISQQRTLRWKPVTGQALLMLGPYSGTATEASLLGRYVLSWNQGDSNSPAVRQKNSSISLSSDDVWPHGLIAPPLRRRPCYVGL